MRRCGSARDQPSLDRVRRALVCSRRTRVDALGALDGELRARGLTGREADVVRQVAAGRSNRDAAVALGVSVRTVQKHLERAFRKLGVKTRSEAAAEVWALASERSTARPTEAQRVYAVSRTFSAPALRIRFEAG